MDLFKLVGRIAVENSEANNAIDETTDKAEDSKGKMSGAFSKIGSAAVACGKAVATGLAVGAAAIAGLVKESVESYAEYEQLVGGIETLFAGTKKSFAEVYDEMSAQGKSVDEIHAKWKEYQQGVITVTDNAAEAYKTAGMSANDYMSTVTSFSASLIQSLGGDTAKAAEYAHMAIVDMSDNANKMGTDISMIQNAYQGFAKQNYTMLDNLKLGYGGTKEEMARLLADAEKISGQKFDISSYADVVEAIHIMQEEMGIAGATSKEAAETISGSAAAMKASWSNLITGMADEEADFEGLIGNFVGSVDTFLGNLMPRIEIALDGAVDLVNALAPKIISRIPSLASSILPSIISAATGLINSLVSILPSLIDILVNDILPQAINGLVSIGDALISALPTVVESICSAFPILLPQLISGVVQLIVSLCQNFGDIIDPIISNLPGIIISVVEAICQNLPILIDGCITLVLGIVSAIPQIIQSLTDSAPTIIEMVVTALLSALPQLLIGVGQLIIGVAKALPTLLKNPIDLTINTLKGLWSAITNLFAPIADWFGEKWESVKQKTSEIWQKVTDFFTVTVAGKFTEFKDKLSDIWQKCVDKVSEVWNKIREYVQFGIDLIASILDAAFQIITLPFRFIWENCKEYVFAAFEWIKEKIDAAITKIKEIAEIGFNFVKEKIINPITEAKDFVVEKFNELKEKAQEKITQLKDKASEIFNSIKDKIITPITNAKNKAVEIFNNLRSQAQEKINSLKEKVTSTFNQIKEKIQTPITNAKNKAVEIFNTLKSNVTSKIDSLKSAVQTKFNDIKNKIQDPIIKARDKVKEMVDKIKGFFTGMKLSLPNIKLPHFKVTGKLSIDPPSVPKLSIEWYKKAMNAPLVMDEPTIFGYNPSTGSFMGGGEAGSEVVSGTDTLMSMIRAAVSAENSATAYYLQQIVGILAEFFPEILERLDSEFDFNDDRLIKRIAHGMDKELGLIAKRKELGV